MTRLDWGLRNLPSTHSRQIQRDLRRDVTATAAEVGMREALADLGRPGGLAEQYTEGTDPEGPRYGSGAAAAAITICIAVFLFVAYAIGTLDTLTAMGGGTRTAVLWGSQTVFVSTVEVTSFETTNILPMILVLLAISALSFLLFSRLWRLGRHSA